MYHFIIPGKKDKAYYHITFDQNGDVLHKHTRNIFTSTGNYTKAYKDFLEKIGINTETVNKIRRTANSIADAKELIEIRQRLADIDKYIENPDSAPAEIKERILSLNLYQEWKKSIN